MSATETITLNSTKYTGGARGTGKRGGARGRAGGNQNARGRGGRANGKAAASALPEAPEEKEQAVEDIPAADVSEDTDVCWICAEPVKYYSVSECNHRTCHVCALRLRALYKKMDCTFCKVYYTSIKILRTIINATPIGTSTLCDIHGFPRCPILVVLP